MFVYRRRQGEYPTPVTDCLIISPDWLIGYDSCQSPHNNISTQLRHTTPGLLQRSPHPAKSHLPAPYGWMFLTPALEWLYDPAIRVFPHWERRASTPCKTEEQTLYTGHQLSIIETVSLQDCVDYCISSKLCRGVMFMEDESMCELKYDMMEPMATHGVN